MFFFLNCRVVCLQVWRPGLTPCHFMGPGIYFNDPYYVTILTMRILSASIHPKSIAPNSLLLFSLYHIRLLIQSQFTIARYQPPFHSLIPPIQFHLLFRSKHIIQSLDPSYLLLHPNSAFKPKTHWEKRKV